MAETKLQETNEFILWGDTSSAGSTQRMEWKPGSPEYNRQSIEQRINDLIATIEANCSTKATWDGLTAAQRQEASRVGLLGLAKLLRVYLGRLESE